MTSTLGKGYQLWLLACIILAVFGSALTLASFMKFIHAIFLGRRPEIYNNIKEAPAKSMACHRFTFTALHFIWNLCHFNSFAAVHLPGAWLDGIFNSGIYRPV